MTALATLHNRGVRHALETEHDVPSQKACIRCHHGEPSAILGISAVQLSRSGTLQKLARRGLLTKDPKRRFEIPGDDRQVEAIGVLHANCGHCHSALGVAASDMRLRFLPEEADEPLEESEIYRTTLGRDITDWKPRPEGFQTRIVPGDPDRSSVVYRMLQRGDEEPSPDQMPPLATERVHEAGLAAVRAWIEAMPRADAELDAQVDEPAPAAAGGMAPDVGNAGMAGTPHVAGAAGTTPPAAGDAGTPHVAGASGAAGSGAVLDAAVDDSDAGDDDGGR